MLYLSCYKTMAGGAGVKFEGGLVWLMPFAGDGQSLLDDEDGLGSVASPSKVSWSSRRRG